LARRISGYGVKEIADHFGRNPVTISEGIKKVEDLQRRDESFAKTLSFMVENMVKGRKRKYRITEALLSLVLVLKHKLCLTPYGRAHIHPQAKPVELCPSGY